MSPTGQLFHFVRACMRMHGLVVEWNLASNVWEPFSLFLLVVGAFPFSLVRVQCVLVSSLISSEFSDFY